MTASEVQGLQEAALTAPVGAPKEPQPAYYDRWTEAAGYCEHDAEIRPRPDGLPSCPSCRRAALLTSAVPDGYAPWDLDLVGGTA